MSQKNKKREKALLVIIIVLFATVVGFRFHGDIVVERYVYEDDNTQSITHNPLIGFAVRGDYAEDIGDNSLVYIEILWKDIEVQKGIYDFSNIYEQYHMDKFKKEGKHAVLRFICDYPGSQLHLDIPEWLYQETGDGSMYDTSYGKGYSPNYANEILIQAHERVLKEIAREFSGDSFLAYIEIGSLGHWGEWHVNVDAGVVPLPTEDICTAYVEQYINAFPNTRLLMRRPFLGVERYGLGVYNDMLGQLQDTDTWLTWLHEGGAYTEPEDVHILYGNENFYQQGAVGGEFTSAVSWEELLVTHFDQTMKMIEDSHISFIGPYVPHELLVPEFQEQANRIRQGVGYKIGISKAQIQYNSFFGTLSIVSNWNNQGIAPMYYNWPAYLYFYGEQGEILGREMLDMDLTELMPQETMKVSWRGKIDWRNVKAVGIGIEDPDLHMPSVTLNNATNTVDQVTILYTRQE